MEKAKKELKAFNLPMGLIDAVHCAADETTGGNASKLAVKAFRAFVDTEIRPKRPIEIGVQDKRMKAFHLPVDLCDEFCELADEMAGGNRSALANIALSSYLTNASLLPTKEDNNHGDTEDISLIMKQIADQHFDGSTRKMLGAFEAFAESYKEA